MYRLCPGCGKLVMVDLALDALGRPWHRKCQEDWKRRRQSPESAPDRIEN